MKYLNLLLLCLVLMSFQCEDNDDNITFPECLQERIDSALNQDPTTPRGTIEKYMFNSEEVYLLSFQNGIADGMAMVVNENCEEICVIGGISGLICEGFEDAEFIETVWEDPR